MSHVKPFRTRVDGAWADSGPKPAFSRIESGFSMYDSIRRSLFHRRYLNSIAVASEGCPRIAETSLICLSWCDCISAGENTLKSISYAFLVGFRSLSCEKPTSGSSSSNSGRKTCQPCLNRPNLSVVIEGNTVPKASIIALLSTTKILILARESAHKLIIRIHSSGRRGTEGSF